MLLVRGAAAGHNLAQVQAYVGHGALASVVQVEQTRAVVQHDTGQDVDVADIGAQHVAQRIMVGLTVPVVGKTLVATVSALNGFLHETKRWMGGW